MGKKYVNGVPDERQNKSSISTQGLFPEDEIFDAGKAEQEYQLSLERGLKEREETTLYNDTLLESADPLIDKVNLIGKKMIVRMKKVYKHNEDGIYIGGYTQEEMNRSEVSKTTVQKESKFQFSEQGVVIKISDDCSDAFKERIKVGTLVDLDPTRWSPGRSMRWLDKSTAKREFDNYFIVSEDYIDWYY